MNQPFISEPFISSLLLSSIICRLGNSVSVSGKPSGESASWTLSCWTFSWSLWIKSISMALFSQMRMIRSSKSSSDIFFTSQISDNKVSTNTNCQIYLYSLKGEIQSRRQPNICMRLINVKNQNTITSAEKFFSWWKLWFSGLSQPPTPLPPICHKWLTQEGGGGALKIFCIRHCIGASNPC